MMTNYLNLSTAELVEKIIERKEGQLSSTGAIVCTTGEFTGRSPKDKFFVSNINEKESNIPWHKNNNYITQESFEKLLFDMKKFMEDKEIFSRYAYAGADLSRKISIKIDTSLAWQDLFCKNLFIMPSDEIFTERDDNYRIICLPDFHANPEVHGTKNKNFTVINFHDKQILIGGTAYAGEIKKSIFTLFNYLMPMKYNDLPMHCSATVGKKGDSAIFFGLSGTGKTTLSADPERLLVGDDEHVWTKDKIFNIEGGCYAKTINLSAEKEPDIYNAIKFGSVLENVPLKGKERTPDFEDDSITENTRVAYTLSDIKNKVIDSIAESPKNIFFLTCDAYGVLPPISLLDEKQIYNYFLLGYTAKIAGTELGIKEPKPTFSACFGEAFLPLDPKNYANQLINKVESNKSRVWLINTGWVRGKYGVGNRIDIEVTRKIINWALEGEIEDITFEKDKIFGLAIPVIKNKSFSTFLFPEKLWDSTEDYNNVALNLKKEFDKNLENF